MSKYLRQCVNLLKSKVTNTSINMSVIKDISVEIFDVIFFYWEFSMISNKQKQFLLRKEDVIFMFFFQ